ncbi:MAG: lytic transglycosylase domain-containing protein [Rikenellaceae bacterium]
MKISLTTLFIILTIGCGSAQDIAKSNNSAEFVNVPTAPESISFSGEKVPLDNVNIKNDLLSEIIVTKYMHSRTLKSILASKQYFSIIEPILKKNGVPDDFKYLCVAESGLDPNAYSYAKAAGLWQILASTATENKLEVNGDIDERYNIEKNTEVACKYLKNAYKRFGSWTMAAASYNVGMAGLARRSETQQETNYYNLFLPTETMRYVYRILTFKILFESPNKLGFNVEEKDYFSPFKYKNILVDDAVINWVAIAKKHGTNYKNLRAINPWIRDYTHTNKLRKTYTVKIPE